MSNCLDSDELLETNSKINKYGHVLFIEPFYGGSHKLLIDNLTKYIKHYSLVTLSAKKWPWRARCGALCIESLIPKVTCEKILFCSSVLSLAELIGLRPDLGPLTKIVYFHENQLVYPVREIKDRDIQYAYNQIITCLCADKIIFNSHYNKNSFLDNVRKLLKMMPDYRPKNIRERIEPKCVVLYFPMEFPKHIVIKDKADILHIVWPHRWEFDKGPETFFAVIRKLKHDRLSFKLSILGETFTDVPKIFDDVRQDLGEDILHFGYAGEEEYYEVLCSSHVVVSTAHHEFFGVSMLEATYCGCYPLVPDDLVYPEIYPEPCLYKSLDDLYQKLKDFCLEPHVAVEERRKLSIDFSQFECSVLIPKYEEVFLTG